MIGKNLHKKYILAEYKLKLACKNTSQIYNSCFYPQKMFIIQPCADIPLPLVKIK